MTWRPFEGFWLRSIFPKTVSTYRGIKIGSLGTPLSLYDDVEMKICARQFATKASSLRKWVTTGRMLASNPKHNRRLPKVPHTWRELQHETRNAENVGKLSVMGYIGVILG